MEKIVTQPISGNNSKKNKFIYIIIWLITAIAFAGIFYSYSEVDEPKESFVLLVEWNGIVNTKPLNQNEKLSLAVGDIIKTYWESTLAIIEWWDGSVTRMWWNSTIEVKDLFISADKNDIQIAFELTRWKTWSNVISFLGENSFFKQDFRDETASVRGTIFSVNLDNEYLFVSDHEVSVSSSEWSSYTIKTNQALSLRNFSLVDLQEYIKDFKDKTWDEINKWFDNELLKSLKAQLEQNVIDLTQANDVVKGIKNLSASEKLKEYRALLTQYQSIKFIDASEKELFNKKIEIQKLLIQFSNQENKQALVRSSLYDLEDAIENKSISAFNKLLPMLDENKAILANLDLDSLTQKITSSNILNTLSDEQLFNIDNIFQDNDFNIEGLKDTWVEILKWTQDLTEWVQDILKKKAWNLFNK